MHSVWNALSGCLWASFGLVVNAESQKSSAKFLILIDFNMKQMGSNAIGQNADGFSSSRESVVKWYTSDHGFHFLRELN